MQNFWAYCGLFLGVMWGALIATWWLKNWLCARRLVDIPNLRSSHHLPTPIGGGWVIFTCALVAWLITHWPLAENISWSLPMAMAVLAVISYYDDIGDLSIFLRLILQAAAVFMVVAFIPENRTVFSPDWPLWMDRFLTAFCWLWFINLFNFMDGIDGLAGTETLFICIGLIVIGTSVGLSLATLQTALVIAAATVGFLWWNWQPSKIFLGDIGAITISFILGWFLIELALLGYPIAAFLLPLYFLSDASLTIAIRFFKGEKFWRPHNSHLYQRASRALQSHQAVVWRIIAANIVLLYAAYLSLSNPVPSILLGLSTVSLLLIHLYLISEKQGPR